MDQALPAAVQAQLDEAEAIEKAIAAEQEARNAPPADTPEPEAKPEPVAEKVAEPQPEARPAEDDTYRARFESLQGKYNAEVPRLYQQVKEANQALAEMRQQLESLKSQPAQPAPVEPTVTSEDEEAFGADLIAVMKKVAKQEAAEVAKQNEQRVSTVDRKVDSVLQDQAVTAGEKFMTAIAQAVPDWETINTDPRWLQWLGEYSPETGAPRQAALDAASANLDSTRTIGMFNLWKSLNPATPSQADKAKQELASQVAPDKSAAAAPSATTDKIWTGEDYERAFDVRLSRTMSQPEIDALQAEAERAYNEGRVRW